MGQNVVIFLKAGQ